jgi:hypothetical protein
MELIFGACVCMYVCIYICAWNMYNFRCNVEVPSTKIYCCAVYPFFHCVLEHKHNIEI